MEGVEQSTNGIDSVVWSMEILYGYYYVLDNIQISRICCYYVADR